MKRKTPIASSAAVTSSRAEGAYPSRPYLVDSIFPLHSLNLLAGPSGSGKTRILFQWLEEAQVHNTLQGRALLQPLQPFYICFDRGIDAVHDLLNTMGIFLDCPMVANLESKKLPDEFPPGTNLLIIDGIDCMIEKINDFPSCADVMRPLTLWAKANDCCILGLLGTTKLKIGNHYASPRERLAGSAALSRFSETLSIIEPINPEAPEDTKRKLSIDPRCRAPFNIFLDAERGSGRLLPFIPASEAGSLLDSLPEIFTFSQFKTASGSSELTAHRALKRMSLAAPPLVEKLRHGVYRNLSAGRRSPVAHSEAQ